MTKKLVLVTKSGRKTRRNPVGRMKRRRGQLARRVGLNFRPNSLIPKRVFIKMKYADTNTVTATNGTPAGIIFRGNSIFDPNQSGGGHQPLGHDTYQTLYNRYKVHACSIHAVVNTETSGVPAIVSLKASTSASNPYASNLDELAEQQNSKLRYISGVNAKAQVSIGAKQSTKQLWGLSSLGQETSYGAEFGYNPARQWYYHLNVQGQDQSTTVVTQVTYTLVYYLELYEPKVLTQS